jgi:hypothetical protein
MISELFIYGRDSSLFKNILKESAVIKGNYHISPDYGHNLNSDNLHQFIRDEKYGLKSIKEKYPIALCMTPKSRIIMINGQKWEEFIFTFWFLTTDKTQNNQVKKLDKATNTSGQHVWDDWDDMKQAASDFHETLKKVIQQKSLTSGPLLRSVINLSPDSAVNFQRVTKVQNDKLNGICMTFALCAFTDACQLKDYSTTAVSDIIIPSLENYSGGE